MFACNCALNDADNRIVVSQITFNYSAKKMMRITIGDNVDNIVEEELGVI